MKRIESIDLLKGIAILGVVTIHSTFYETNYLPNMMLDIFFKFGVPLFVFLSGYWTFKKRNFIQTSFKKYLLDCFKKIAVPYIALTTIITAATLYKGFNLILFFKAIAKNLITGSASNPYYYIIVIFQFFIMSKFILYTYNKHYKKLLTFAFFSTLFYSILFYTQILIFKQIKMPFFIGHFPNYFLWFAIGIDYAAKGIVFKAINKINLKIHILMAVTAFIFCFLEVSRLRYNNLSDGGYIALSSIIWELIFVSLLWKIKDLINCKPLQTLGKYSFAIFLFHQPFLDIYFEYFKVVKTAKLAIFYVCSSILFSVILAKLGNLNISHYLSLIHYEYNRILRICYNKFIYAVKEFLYRA